MRNGHALYRFFDADGQLLYVGLTSNPGSRWAAHERGKPWWHEVSTVGVEKHDSLESVAQAEREAIRRENPRYNTAHASSEAADLARARLVEVAEKHGQAQALAHQARDELRATVSESVAAGVSESEVARLSGMTRMTIRSWIGKGAKAS